MSTARVLDGHTYCPSCSDYVGAQLTLYTRKILPCECYRCGARTQSAGMDWVVA